MTNWIFACYFNTFLFLLDGGNRIIRKFTNKWEYATGGCHSCWLFFISGQLLKFDPYGSCRGVWLCVAFLGEKTPDICHFCLKYVIFNMIPQTISRTCRIFLTSGLFRPCQLFYDALLGSSTTSRTALTRPSSSLITTTTLTTALWVTYFFILKYCLFLSIVHS